MGGSPAVTTEELKYLYASNVNVSNFVSVKLSSDDNYPLWKAQMLCLLESQQMRGIVDNLFDHPRATNSKTVKQYDSLLKGWIFGSLSPDVLKAVVDLESAREVWRKLQSIYDSERRFEEDAGSTSLQRFTGIEPHGSTSTEGSNEIQPQDPSVQIEIPTVTEQTSIDAALKRKLLKATVKGSWWQAESILKNEPEAATQAITEDGNTMLHVAVARGWNDFVKHLLNFIHDPTEIEKQNSDGRTALHIAAIVGNRYGAQLLLQKRKESVGIADNKAHIPLVSAYYNMKLDTFVDLLGPTRWLVPADQLSGFFPDSVFNSGDSLVITLIFRKQYDIALDRLYIIRDKLNWSDEQVLIALAKNFPSGLRFDEALIYPSLSNVHQKLVERCSLLYHAYEFLLDMAKDILWATTESKISCYGQFFLKIVIIIFVPIAMLYPIYQLICIFILVLFYPFIVMHFLLWKVLTTVVMPIKHIDKKKKDYMKAKRFLQWVCNYTDKDKSNFSGSNHPSYSRPILEAARQGAHEVVKEILLRSPKTIGSKSTNGHNIIQLTVINRSEKVYNVICPFIDRMDLSTNDSVRNYVQS